MLDNSHFSGKQMEHLIHLVQSNGFLPAFQFSDEPQANTGPFRKLRLGKPGSLS
jgi:hypothetical protein